MKTLKTVLLATCVIAVPMFATAAENEAAKQTIPKTEVETKSFQEVDTDKSGSISSAEAQLSGVKNFEMADQNKDGELDKNEYAVAARNDRTAR